MASIEHRKTLLDTDAYVYIKCGYRTTPF